jgi:magnesium-transporting ATPase (P-type)
LVVGDVIKLEQGMRIPADAVLIDGIDISTDESAMTGEPEHMEKAHITDANYDSNPDPFLLGKSLIVNGMGTAIVCAVGTNTRSGMAEEKLNTEEDETPLQQKLGSIANSLGKLGVYCALLALVAGFGNFIVRRLVNEHIGWFGNATSRSESFNDIIKIIITGITVIVIAVPEGLPLAVTLSFAFSVMKMKTENNLVRKL